ncbi:MAG: glycoside hydrolase family 15 protein [Nitrospirota bacterium]|nr:glycoside hydrolase family 15 protein [Nitrospirota bacterium]
MPKDIPVSNGNLLFNFDLDYRIRDVYFPLIGQENHSKGHPFRFGVWADGNFSWMGPGWTKDLRYRDNSLVTEVFLKNEDLGLELRCRDAVDFDLNVYIKEIEARDLRGRERQVRLFFTQDFHLYGNEIGDTVYFDPRTRSIIHYKANRYFLVNCHENGKPGVECFACGFKEVSGKQGTWKDAEDGELSGNPVAWGSADSTIGIRLNVPPGGKATGFYWLAAGTRYHEVARLNQDVSEKTPAELLNRTSAYWTTWVQKETRSFGDLPEPVTNIFNRSLLILRTQIDNRGPIIAANDSDIVGFAGDTYSYMWGRDGAFVAATLAKAGYAEVCRRFFGFCSEVLSEDGYLFQHYNPDGSLASTWHSWVQDGKEVLPIQEDSTALVLWALWIHYQNSKDIEFVKPLYKTLIQKSADFLVAHRDPGTLLPIPSYDLWEERYGTHSFTVAAVIAGLKAAANFAKLFQDASLTEKYDTAVQEVCEGLAKHLYHTGLKRYARSGYRKGSGYELDEVIDVSLLGLVTLGVLPPKDPRMVETIEAIRRQLWLKTRIGGCARFQDDRYQRPKDCPKDVAGNPWFISTLWLGECFIARAESLGELHEAVPYLEWCAKNALPSGVLAEQVHPVSGRPLSVSPLTWSHSAFVWTVLQYAEKFNFLKNNGACGAP